MLSIVLDGFSVKKPDGERVNAPVVTLFGYPPLSKRPDPPAPVTRGAPRIFSRGGGAKKNFHV